MRKPVYLDHQATTPADPRVIEAMLPYFGVKFGNAASRSHAFGWDAEQAVDLAAAGCRSRGRGTARDYIHQRRHRIQQSRHKGRDGGESRQGQPHCHDADRTQGGLDTVKRLELSGSRATVLSPRNDGLLDLDRLREAITPETVLVSVMHANNEIGVIQPVENIRSICHERGVLFHCDAAQSFGTFNG